MDFFFLSQIINCIISIQFALLSWSIGLLRISKLNAISFNNMCDHDFPLSSANYYRLGNRAARFLHSLNFQSFSFSSMGCTPSLEKRFCMCSGWFLVDTFSTTYQPFADYLTPPPPIILVNSFHIKRILFIYLLI